MQMITLLGTDLPVGPIYAYPDEQSLSDWLLYRVPLTEGTGSDAGRYVGLVDPANGTSLVAFAGESQPASWADALPGVGWDLLIAAIKADADLGTADGGMVANVAMLGVAIDGYTFTEAQRLMLAAMFGKIAGGGTGTNEIYAADESKIRITATYDSVGNRTITDADAT